MLSATPLLEQNFNIYFHFSIPILQTSVDNAFISVQTSHARTSSLQLLAHRKANWMRVTPLLESNIGKTCICLCCEIKMKQRPIKWQALQFVVLYINLWGPVSELMQEYPGITYGPFSIYHFRRHKNGLEQREISNTYSFYWDPVLARPEILDRNRSMSIC